MSGVIDPARLKELAWLARRRFWLSHIMAAFDPLKTKTTFCPVSFLFISVNVLMGEGLVSRWTLISNFAQLRNNFKVGRPEGWKQGEKAERIKNSSIYMRSETYPRQQLRGTYNI